MFFRQCVENVSHANCPVCLEDIHTSRIPCHIPDCGHLLHRTCFDELLYSGHYACPTCQVSLLDMTELWRFLDKEVSHTPMPPEYKDYKADILCKDCHKESTVKFHVVGLKCLNCGSYNTCRIKGSPCPGKKKLSHRNSLGNIASMFWLRKRIAHSPTNLESIACTENWANRFTLPSLQIHNRIK